MGAISELMNLLSEIPVSAVLRERVLLVIERMNDLDKRVKNLEEDNTRLANKAHDLEKQLASQAVAEEYTEYRGALFKRKLGEGYHHAVYCPRCKTSTSTLGDLIQYYRCASCKWASDFKAAELEAVMRDLPE